VLTRLRGLRGTAFDVFGYTEERRTERALIATYRQDITQLLAGLTQERLALAVEIASIPEGIRGYGHVKERHLEAAQAKRAALLAQWHGPVARVAGDAPQRSAVAH
ncbi:MAG: DUF6537 domain-containing protein, partial [Comamonas sp.]